MNDPEQNEIQVEKNAAPTSKSDAITELAGALPSSLQELKESLGITRLMREGTSIADGVAAILKLSETGENGDKNNNSKPNKIEKPTPSSSNGDKSNTAPNLSDILRPGSGKDSTTPNSNSDKNSAEDRMHKPGDSVGEIHKILEAMNKHTVGSAEKGVIKLPTGDKLVRAGDAEILIRKNGETVLVKDDGSIELGDTKGVTVKTDKETNATTLTFANGDTVRIRGGRVTDVKNNDGVSVHMNSALEDRFKDFQPDWPRREGKGGGGGGGGGNGPERGKLPPATPREYPQEAPKDKIPGWMKDYNNQLENKSKK